MAGRIRAALAGDMSVRKTAAKFDVNPSTGQRIARPFDGATQQASPPRDRQIGGALVRAVRSFQF
jgi:hypothetical protein